MAEPQPRAASGDGGAEAVVDWLLTEGRRQTRMRDFGDELCLRMVDAGIPLWRIFCGIRTLHPLVAATAYVWYRDEPATERLVAAHGVDRTPVFLESAPYHVMKTDQVLRRRLEDPDCSLDFPMLDEFRDKGGTDYIGLPLRFASGEVNVMTFATDRPGGFTDEDVAGLARITEVLAMIVELQASRRIARALLSTYVGPRTGQHVLAGEITRGSGEEIRAVIWLCDLRGFTAFADELSREALLALLNDYFETIAGAITAAGGEVLKFVGDAVLAIFPIDDERDAAAAAQAALEAAGAAEAAVTEVNARRHADGAPEVRYALALHLGDVMYGNIGAPDRLDFTVIGPAVNHAARLEALAAEQDRGLVLSESFAAALEAPSAKLGDFEFKGVAAKQAVYVPAG